MCWNSDPSMHGPQVVACAGTATHACMHGPQVVACAVPEDCSYSGRMDNLIKYQAEMILFPEL